MNTYLFCSSAQKSERKTAGHSRRGAPWDPSASEDKEGSLARAGPLLSDTSRSRESSASAKCCLCCLVHASETSRLPVSLGLFLPVPRGLVISLKPEVTLLFPRSQSQVLTLQEPGRDLCNHLGQTPSLGRGVPPLPSLSRLSPGKGCQASLSSSVW